jgi:1,2-diacylglycerol 3-alpha-glucosyltransferase
MNIAIFTNNYLPNPFGVAGSIESFRNQFEKLGHTVFIFAPKTKNYHDSNPRVFRYPSIDLNYKISFPLALPYSKKIDKVIENLDLDIIHSQHPNLLGNTAKKWAKRKNIPLVFTWHTLYDQYVHFAPFIPKKFAADWIIKRAVKYANESDFVITPTPGIKKIIADWGVKNKNVKAISTGIEEKLYQNPDRNSIRRKYNVKDNEILLLLVSRISAEKNIDFVFNSAIKILKNSSAVKFMICGDGHLIPKLKNLSKENNLQDRIIFSGIIKKENLKNYYSAGDVFVYASKSETQGMIVTEAMYMGLPIVAVDAPGICDLVQNNVNGFLVKEDENEFSFAVEKIITDELLRQKFSAESARIARENYTDKICAEKMLKVYESLLKNKQP